VSARNRNVPGRLGALLFAIAAAALLAGCATTREPAEVLVPVAVCEVPQLPARPVLPTSQLPAGASAADKARALAASVLLLDAEAKALREVLEAMKKPEAAAGGAR
jgi:outer membrane murein-binding lipoprotein Lpp